MKLNNLIRKIINPINLDLKKFPNSDLRRRRKLLDILPSHLKSAPESKIIGNEMVSIKSLDIIYNDLVTKKNIIFFKIDVQGFEKTY